jgi:hypothetical protein
LVSFPTASQDFFLGQGIPVKMKIAFPNPTIQAIVTATITDFDEPSDQDFISKDLLCHFTGTLE